MLAFDQAFWRTAGLPHLMLFPEDPDESTMWVIGHDAFGEGAILVFFIFHGTAGRVLGMTPGDTADWACGLLTQAIGAPCPAPTAVAVTSWATDPYSMGAYTHIPPGAGPADADLLGEPLHGRLLFAGEHTQSARLVYTDGAMASGIREAKRLLQRLASASGRPPGPGDGTLPYTVHALSSSPGLRPRLGPASLGPQGRTSAGRAGRRLGRSPGASGP